MQRVRGLLSEAHGATFEVGGEPMAAFPTPARLLAVEAFPEVPPVKMDRLHAVAGAALEGRLDPGQLRSAEPEEAMRGLQQIDGIGPFYSSLILIRATGVTDVLPADEPRVREIARTLYGLGATPTVAEFAELAEPWRPWRTWAVVLMRAAGSRLIGTPGNG
jgi:DNA-3-methyladenine glycosylase II